MLDNVLRLIAVITVLCLLTTSATRANAGEAVYKGPVTTYGTTQYVLHSAEIDQNFQIDVAVPLTYEMTEQKLPVVYVTDSNGFFLVYAGMTRALQLGGELPPIILVGIGYEIDNIMEMLSLRNRDLTPSFDKQWTEQAQSAPPPLGMSREISTGGADDFLRFIEADVKPFINEKYRTDPDNETIVGYSLGGLFALHVLFNHSDTFDKFIVGSPSIWWDQAISFTYEENYAKKHDDLPKRVFISSGSLEETDDPEDTAKMVTNARVMYARLKERGYPGLEIQHYVFDGETHMSGIAASINRGLRSVFSGEMAQPQPGNASE
ncbi:MAG: alpha/beta hydrolase-fold protein [Gammaproteobacteria bacterium]|nr:alpha/beta hydrolase-fold protein [Gammaproteobacteria bacterium]